MGALQQLKERYRLTPREVQVVEHVNSGLTNQQVAAQLGMSPETVRKHLASVYRKLGTSGRVNLLRRLHS